MTAAASETFPVGIEQARRDFMRDNRTLYDYLEARLQARTWGDAGDTASGAEDEYAASNRCYAQEGRFTKRSEEMREQHPNPRAHKR